MSNVIRLPTASTSYFTIRKTARGWAVQIVTPIEGLRPLRTTLAVYADRDGAIAYGRNHAALIHRPFKIRGAVQ